MFVHGTDNDVTTANSRTTMPATTFSTSPQTPDTEVAEATTIISTPTPGTMPPDALPVQAGKKKQI